MTDFLKEWRALIKNSKFKNIQIFNQTLFCQHGFLPFDEKTIDFSMSTLLTEFEWEFISTNYIFDTQIKLKKHLNLNDSEESLINFEFEPQVCQDCMAQNELDKMLFENKKILIRFQDEEENNCTSKLENLKNEEMEDTDVIHISSKKARYSINENGTDPQTNGKQVLEYIPARRSKRSRRSKKDLEVVCSSYTTIKLIKQNIASQISRLMSEQHLIFNNIELDNDRTLIDYKINKGDLLVLKLDQIDSNMDEDSSHYEMAHVPEVGFKGSNLIGFK
ncbi:Ubiquitin carboxyl-terminal hydrolase 48 [Brachionus plicatilis]|uniref:Ubiquitin carboxyl-terminal hydrolase 48 n=1 Tax=Brachionus plicatilis TaxID=10195 RepID=A0A3M7PCC5_BRAPC|nr:Ubiquitin carboxyl-terminal hydrolase 48 [Brachionus plicatilis]